MKQVAGREISRRDSAHRRALGAFCWLNGV